MDCLAYWQTASVTFAETAVKLLPVLARMSMAGKYTSTIIIWVTSATKCGSLWHFWE